MPSTLHSQPSTFGELPLFKASKEDPNVERFLGLLAHYGRLTRRQFVSITGWSERDVRALAEAAGARVVRGQEGFCLFETADAEEVLRAAEAAISQGKRMIKYGLALKSALHGRVG